MRDDGQELILQRAQALGLGAGCALAVQQRLGLRRKLLLGLQVHHTPTAHLCANDLILEPGGSGFGVLRACRDCKPGQKVVALTATANPDMPKRCKALGSDGVFDKSMETDPLIDYCLALAQAARE